MQKNKIIFHIDMNAFFASVEEAINPALKNKPMVVGAKTRRAVVSTANYEARKYGIKSGMPIFQALSLCKKLIVVPHKMWLYEEYSQKFINLLSKKITNKIEVVSIDECYMDVTNLINKQNAPYKLATKIQNLIKKELQIGSSIGISYNKFLAKMGSDYKKPMGITEIMDTNAIKKIIWPQKIQNMYFVGHSTEKELVKNCILTIGDLANSKDYNLLKNIFGKNWEWYVQNANGIGDDELNYSYNDPKTLTVSETLYSNTSDFKEIKTYIKKFSYELVEKLEYYSLEGKTISVFIKDPNFVVKIKSKTLSHYVKTIDEIYPLFNQLYESNFLNKEIRLVGVGISNLKGINVEFNSEIFDQKPTKKPKTNVYKKIIDNINDKFSLEILTTADKIKN